MVIVSILMDSQRDELYHCTVETTSTDIASIEYACGVRMLYTCALKSSIKMLREMKRHVCCEWLFRSQMARCARVHKALRRPPILHARHSVGDIDQYTQYGHRIP